MWIDLKAGRDIWNGRWTPDILSFLLGEASQNPIERRDFQRALKWLIQLTQNAQRVVYGVRHVELLSMEAKACRATVISLQRKRKVLSAHNLFAASKIPYAKPPFPRRKMIHPTTFATVKSPVPTTQSLQFSKAKTLANFLRFLNENLF
jgi:hypothetical protein